MTLGNKMDLYGQQAPAEVDVWCRTTVLTVGRVPVLQYKPDISVQTDEIYLP